MFSYQLRTGLKLYCIFYKNINFERAARKWKLGGLAVIRKAWMELKELLVQEPVLKFYTSGRPMKILIGASQFDLGEVILQ